MARRKSNSKLPSFDELIIPTVKALIELGGSGSIEEINTKVYEIYDLGENILSIPHGENGTTSEVDYRLAWSRTYLKKFGLLENSTRGIWALVNSNVDISTLNSIEIVRAVREQEKLNAEKNKRTDTYKAQVKQEVAEEVDNSEE